MGGVEVPLAPREWGVGGVSRSPLGKGSGEGLSRKFFVFLLKNTIFLRNLTRLGLFLKLYANGRDSNPL